MSKCNLTRFSQSKQALSFSRHFNCAPKVPLASGELNLRGDLYLRRGCSLDQVVPLVCTCLWFYMEGDCFDGGSLRGCAEVGWSWGGGGQAFSRHIDTEIDIILKRLLAMVALRLQLQHRSLSPIRLSIIHVMDFMGFSRYFRPYWWRISFIYMGPVMK